MALIDRLLARASLAFGHVTRERPDSGLDEVRLSIGSLHAREVRGRRFPKISQAEFRVFSQFGEDGIIQYLLGHVPIANEQFVEFGVEDYSESNTRFLVANDNWRGLVLDGGSSHVDFLRRDAMGWRHSVRARSAFITRENINSLIASEGVAGDIGLLSIDIDGNDYWILEAIDVVQPRILIIEYNSTFGPHATVSVPYAADFDRTRAHTSNLYWGASLAALAMAADAKGLALVGSNKAGNNAFFVRTDLLGDLDHISPAAAWVDARFRESRGPEGDLTFVEGQVARAELIASMPLVDVRTGRSTTVADAVGLGPA